MPLDSEDLSLSNCSVDIDTDSVKWRMPCRYWQEEVVAEKREPRGSYALEQESDSVSSSTYFHFASNLCSIPIAGVHAGHTATYGVVGAGYLNVLLNR